MVGWQTGTFLPIGNSSDRPTQSVPDRARSGYRNEVAALAALLARLDLRPVDEAIASIAVALSASYGLRSADAVHRATAVSAGVDCFITNNRRDFSQSIEEVSVTYPTDLP
jgi:predicted nucleic acid-binding protein